MLHTESSIGCTYCTVSKPWLFSHIEANDSNPVDSMAKPWLEVIEISKLHTFCMMPMEI